MNNKQVHSPVDCLLSGVQRLKPQTYTVWLDGWEGPHISSTIFLLEEMVGSQSHFKFTLQHWDGKYMVFSLPLAFP